MTLDVSGAAGSAEAGSAEAGSAEAGSAEAAALWRRLCARATDLVVVMFIQFVLVVVQIFWFMDALSSRFTPEPWGRPFVATLVYIALYGGYEVFFHVRGGGQTPGKILFKIEVVSCARLRAGAERRAPGWWQAVARWAVGGVALPLLFAPNDELLFVHYKIWALGLWLAPGVAAVFSQRRYSAADWLVNTRVVRHVETEEELQQLDDMKRRRTELREKYGLGRFGLFNKLK